MVSLLIIEAVLIFSLIYITAAGWKTEAQLIESDPVAGDKLGYYLVEDDKDIAGILDKQQLAADLFEELASAYRDENYNKAERSSPVGGNGDYYGLDETDTQQPQNYMVASPGVNVNNMVGVEQVQEQTRYPYLMRRSGYDPLDESISPPVNDPVESQRVALELMAQQMGNLSFIERDTGDTIDSDPAMYDTDQYSLGGSGPINDPISAAANILSKPVVAPATLLTQHKQDSEYIDHPLVLSGHQSVQGGAGEGRQLLGPDGTFENVQVIKTDHPTSSYCDPPNPCPIGYTAKDGCLEKFVNSASFSREYQAKQECSCDNEHSLFNCAAPITTENGLIKSGVSLATDDVDQNSDVSGAGYSVDNSNYDHLNQQESDNEMGITTLARAIKNRFGDLAAVKNIVAKQNSGQQID